MPTDSPCRILIVDDDADVLQSARRMLERHGHLVMVHDGGPGCLNMAQRFEPDLVLVDVRMPFVAGNALVSLLTKHAGASRPTVVLFSGMDEPALERTATNCGADGFISKADPGSVFIRKVSGFLRRRASAMPLPRPPAVH